MVKLRVTDPTGASREWPVARFDVDHGGVTFLISCDLDDTIEQDSNPPDSLAAADKFVATIIKRGSMDQLHVLYWHLYTGLGIRLHAATAARDRLKGAKS